MLTIIILAIYTIAFLFDRKIHTILIPCLICEFIGWSPMFTWLNIIDYGMLTHVMWGMVYAYYILIVSSSRRLILSCGVMVLFQLIMSIDCWRCEGNETSLFILYKYIVVLIHCCIIFTFLSRRRVITTMGNIASVFRMVIANYGFNVGFWYNTFITYRK